MKLNDLTLSKVLKIIKSCNTYEQIKITRNWLCTLRYWEKVDFEANGIITKALNVKIKELYQ